MQCRLPHGIDSIEKQYGKPWDGPSGKQPPFEWMQEHRPYVKLPFPLRASWNVDAKITKLRMHPQAHNPLLTALESLAPERNRMRKLGIDLCGGGYVHRMKRGSGRQWSTHAYGIAIDLNPAFAPLGCESFQPLYIVEAFEEAGWYWLSHDGMHAQLCTGY